MDFAGGLVIEGPSELDPFLLYARVAAAIEAATSLRQMPDDLVGGREQPTQIVDRYFRIEPRGMTFPTAKRRPGDECPVTEQVAVLLHHDLQVDFARSTYQVASADFIALLVAVLTRTEISGLAEPIPVQRILRLRSQSIEQDLVLNLTYSIALPESAGPVP